MSGAKLAERKSGSRIASVEFWRFLFTVLVCLYHLEIYYTKGKLFPSGTSAVEFFFVLAGFLLAMSASHFFERHPDRLSPKEAAAMATQFVWKKVKAIFPVLVIVLILHLAVNGAGYIYKTTLDAALHMEWELLFMVGTSFGYGGGMAPIVPLWFLTALLVAGYVYCYMIYRHYDFTLYLAPLIGVLLYSYFTLNSSLVLDFNVKMGFLTAGMVKGFAEMALGIAVFKLYDHLRHKKLGPVWQLALTLLMLFAVYRYFALTIKQPIGMDNFRRIIYILIIVLLSFLNKDEVTHLFNNPVSRWLGSISLPMYISHYTLCNVFFDIINALKKKFPTSAFLKDMGGASGWNAVDMSWKDRLCYLALVIVVSALLVLIAKLLRLPFRKKPKTPPQDPPQPVETTAAVG